MASSSTPLKQPIEPERPRDIFDDMSPAELAQFRRETEEAEAEGFVDGEEAIAMLRARNRARAAARSLR